MDPPDGGATQSASETAQQIISILGAGMSLFGEQVTRQFLSTIVSSQDYFLLASCPIGVIFIVASTIRIAGWPWLKTLIGRSRDEPAVVEKELLSSTSTEVCEAWTGTTISRTKGFLPPGSITTLIITESGNIKDLQSHLAPYNKPRGSSTYWELENGGNTLNKHEYNDFKFMVNGSPNFTLNLRKRSWNRRLLSSCAVAAGMVIQIAAWALVGIWVDTGAQQVNNGVICFFIGAGLTFLGLLASGYITNTATTERRWRFPRQPADATERRRWWRLRPRQSADATVPEPQVAQPQGVDILVADPPVALVWLQRGCVVEAQYFPPYAIFKPLQTEDENMDVHVSLRNQHMIKPRWYMQMAMVLSVLTVPGSILQGFGTWFLEWEVGVTQVVAMGLVTFLRTFSRRELTLSPTNFEVADTQELASLVISITASEKSLEKKKGGIREWIKEAKNLPATGFHWGLVTGRLHVLRGGQQNRGTVDVITRPQAPKPPVSSIRQRANDGNTTAVGPLVEVQRFTAAARDMSHLVRPEVTAAVKQLERALEGVAELLRSEGHADVCWKAGPIFGRESDSYDRDSNRNNLEWLVSLAHGNESPDRSLVTEQLAYHLLLVPAPMEDRSQHKRWVLKDSRELCATISLWLNRLATARPGSKLQGRLFKENDLYRPQEFCRIGEVGSSSPSFNSATARKTLEQWTGCNVYVVEGEQQQNENPTGNDCDESESRESAESTICFGMHLAYPFEDAAATTSHDAPVLSPENGAGGSAPQDTLRYYVTAAVNTTLVTQCAQELFSLFIFAIAANITKVGGKTTKAPLQSGSVRVWDNTLLTAIAQQAVEAKLAPTLEKALALVIPAFARHNLVPVTPPLEAQEEAKMGTRRRWVSSRYSNSKCEEEIILMECSRRG